MLNFINGKKTYIIAAIAGILAVAEQLGYHVPDSVWPLLGALGLGTLRHSVANVA